MNEFSLFRTSWTLRGRFDEFVVVPAIHCPANLTTARASPFSFRAEMEHWVNDPWSARTLMDIYQRTGGLGRGEEHLQQVKAHLEQAVQWGQLVVLVRPKRKLEIPLPSTRGAAKEKEVEALGWIALELRDKRGRPVSNTRYRIKDRSGAVYEGTSDGRGIARIEGIPEGSCILELPQTDAEGWRLL